MALPEWAKSPGKGYEHNDNYSDVDVVWTNPDGNVILQRAPGFGVPAPVSTPETPESSAPESTPESTVDDSVEPPEWVTAPSSAPDPAPVYVQMASVAPKPRKPLPVASFLSGGLGGAVAWVAFHFLTRL